MMRKISALPLISCLILGACGHSESEDLPTWSAADHQHQGSSAAPTRAARRPNNPAQTSGRPSGSAQMPSLAGYGVSEVVIGTWKNQCMRCHGLIGQGDGPQGALAGAKDLTNPVWQKEISDAQIKNSILKGKGRMPAFAQIPIGTIDGLIKLVRLLNRDAARTLPRSGK